MEKAGEKTAKKERRDGYCKKERKKTKTERENNQKVMMASNLNQNLNIWCCMLVNVNYSVDRFFS